MVIDLGVKMSFDGISPHSSRRLVSDGRDWEKVELPIAEHGTYESQKALGAAV